MRYTLEELFPQSSEFASILFTKITGSSSTIRELLMGLTLPQVGPVMGFLSQAIYGYFHSDLVAYDGETDTEVARVFVDRLCYDIAVKMPYWVKKYNMVKKLLTTEDLSLLQTSKVTSSSSDATHSAGGTLQKGATTPTGVSAETSPDEININMNDNEGTRENSVVTNGFVDKYTNHQQKFVNASEIKGEREGEILREGSIDELLNILEKLPASFSDEITRDLQKHFIFDYDGEERGLYA